MINLMHACMNEIGIPTIVEPFFVQIKILLLMKVSTDVLRQLIVHSNQVIFLSSFLQLMIHNNSINAKEHLLAIR